MKKRMHGIFVLLIALGLLCGCTGTPDTPAAPDTSDTPVTTDAPQPSPVSDFEYTAYNDTLVRIAAYIGTDTDVVIPGTIDGMPVAVISASAFADTAIETVYIPDSVETIVSSAFQNCAALREVRFGGQLRVIGEHAFAGCASLALVDLRETALQEIRDGAFLGCTNLAEIRFADTITKIGDQAFMNCTSLTAADLPGNLSEIGEYAFGDCLGLRRVFIPKTLSVWGMSPFLGNLSLTEIVLEDGLTAIGFYGAFAGCSATELTIPASVESIADIAFTGFENLETVTFLGNAPARVGGMAFGFPTSKLTIRYDAAATGWDTTSLKQEYRVMCRENPASDFTYEMADGGVILKKYVGDAAHVIVPAQIEGKDVIELAPGCFEESAVEYVALPESVQIIGAAAFMNCPRLSSIILPDAMEEIRTKAFENCTSLTHIILPYGNLFRNCHDVFLNAGLESVAFRGGIEILSTGAFAQTKLTEIHLPSSVREIEIGSLACETLQKVVLNDGLEIIRAETFAPNNKLTEIVIPASVTTLSEYAFVGCTALTKVKFEGNAPTFVEYEDIMHQMMGDFYPDYPAFTVYYHEEAEGFTDPAWDKFHRELW